MNRNHHNSAAMRACLSIVSLIALASTGCVSEDDPGIATEELEAEAAEPETAEAEPEAAEAEPETDDPPPRYVTTRPTQPGAEEHLIDIEEATNLATFIGASKTIDEATAIPDELGEAVFHIINYQEGGFLILAADDRVSPVLAYADEGSFDLDVPTFPEALVGWLVDQKDIVQEVRTIDAQAAPPIHPCDLVEQVTGLPPNDIQAPGEHQAACPGEPPVPCNNFSVEVGPLLQTTWGQKHGYNDALPFMNCDLGDNDFDGRPPTGCVATAMAQVMRYHQEPAGYNWGAMPDDEGTSATAGLMADLGDAVDMRYGCNNSTAHTDEVAGVLKNEFGFSSANYTNFNFGTVKSEINNGYPVILRGGKKDYWWIFPYDGGGHAWVTDGYRTSHVCATGITTNEMNMNWGWGGAYDGWFAINNWNPSNKTYNYGRKMVYNIRP